MKYELKWSYQIVKAKITKEDIEEWLRTSNCMNSMFINYFTIEWTYQLKTAKNVQGVGNTDLFFFQCGTVTGKMYLKSATGSTSTCTTLGTIWELLLDAQIREFQCEFVPEKGKFTHEAGGYLHSPDTKKNISSTGV